MSTLHIPDDILKQAGISEHEALVELACTLYQTGKLTLFFAARLANLPQPEFEDLLLDRKIPLYQYGEDALKNDLATLRRGKH
jgi:predicted HTH domain antitoxin